MKDTIISALILVWFLICATVVAIVELFIGGTNESD